MSRSVAILCLGFFSASAFPVGAGAAHEHVRCAACHLKTEAQLRDDGYDRSDAPDSARCLSCHDAGRDVSGFAPPHVLNGHRELAGGSFTPTLRSDKVGHNIFAVDPALGGTPPGGAPLEALGCLSCHDAHANGNFRHLKTEINGRQTPVTAVADPNFKENVYISGMNAFCCACHELFFGGSDAHRVHPVGVAISLAKHTDFRRWCAVNDKVTRAEYPAGNPKNHIDARVFCLSCHRAHASPYRDALRWDYGNTARGCLECHSF